MNSEVFTPEARFSHLKKREVRAYLIIITWYLHVFDSGYFIIMRAFSQVNTLIIMREKVLVINNLSRNCEKPYYYDGGNSLQT